MSQIWSPLSREQQIERLASLGLHLNLCTRTNQNQSSSAAPVNMLFKVVVIASAAMSGKSTASQQKRAVVSPLSFGH